MGAVIVILLLCWLLFGPGPFDNHCPRRCGGFFSRRDCYHCPENEGSGCLTWIIGAIVLYVILF